MNKLPFTGFHSLLTLRAAADLIEENLSTGVTYLGICDRKCLTSEQHWTILRITEITANSIVSTKIEYADGSCSFNAIWDNRAALTYTFKNF